MALPNNMWATLVLVATCLLVGSAPPDMAEVRFYWAAQVATGTGGAARYAVVEHDYFTLESGARLRFYLSPATPVFAYLIHFDAQGAAELLSAPSAAGASPLAPGVQKYYGWFTLDGEPGRERIQLIVSATRLEALERLLAAATASGADKGRATATVVEEIARLRKLHGQLEKPAPRPATIAGSMRAQVPDLAAVAVEVSAAEFYSRTYIIEHR